ncbi:hypothetical protein [Mycolicibacterium septicum]|uniref:hypothetical protein n=1 Tax=Mycolicibacterium septicum TaxID=98668 RepID=UPI001AF67561|nr:hypothetical protein [Mycolicibacterium septicum]QRY51743.1 hypothetical protein JVX95_30955 [Mycolicibacterium septicum]
MSEDDKPSSLEGIVGDILGDTFKAIDEFCKTYFDIVSPKPSMDAYAREVLTERRDHLQRCLRDTDKYIHEEEAHLRRMREDQAKLSKQLDNLSQALGE